MCELARPKGVFMYKTLLAGLMASCLILGGCHKTKTEEKQGGEATMIKNGTTVSMNYTLKVDGKVVDTSEGKEPLVFVQGSGQIIPGLDNALLEMKKGEKKHVTVDPEDGYGNRIPEAVRKIPKAAFDGADKLKVGDVVNGNANGQEFVATVSAVSKDEITIDMNHPLAGKTLDFDIEIVDIK